MWENHALTIRINLSPDDLEVNQRSRVVRDIAQTVEFEPTLQDGNWFQVSRLNHSATSAELSNISIVKLIVLTQSVFFLISNTNRGIK